MIAGGESRQKSHTIKTITDCDMAEIKKAQKSHLKAIFHLLQENESHTEEVEENIENFWIICEGKEIIGCAGLEIYGKVALLRSVAIRKDRQHKGLGQTLTRSILAFAKKRKVKKLYLLTLTAADFFRKFGFRRIERDEVDHAIQKTAEFRCLCPSSAAVMVKELDR